ncbi:MAG: hypothetical protein M3547_01105 [Acidobacteriota bacterium]|nr:hypothetical protein [Acidobacteriota bacterium]
MKSEQRERLVPISSAVTPEVRATLKAIAKKENRSVSQVLRFVIERYAKRKRAA